MTRTGRWALRLLVCAVTMLYVFYTQVSTSFSMLLGDTLDGLIQTSIMQHWFNVFRGLERWDTTAYFYPHAGTLGYNDGFFLNGVIFSIARALGADPFLASDMSSIVIRAAGFFAFEVFATNVLALGFGWALLGAALFTLANNLCNQMGHAQLLTVSFVPLLGWLLWRALEALRAAANMPAVLWGSAAALLYGAWLLTGFYMAWFTFLFLTLVVLAAAVQEAFGRGAGWRAWRSLIAWPLIPVGAMLALASLPFLLVYLPKAGETGAHQLSTIMAYSPSLPDLLHVGSMNLVFGGMDRWLTQAIRPGFADYGEHTIGFPPVVAILAVAGAALALFSRRARQPLILRSIAAATVLSFAVLVHIGNHTLWYLVYTYFPGGSAVRVVARYALFLTFPIVLLAMSFLQSRARLWPGWVIACLAGILLIEEITTFGQAGLDRKAELKVLAATPPAPPACRAFFVHSTDRPSTGNDALDSVYLHNVDPMMLAEMRALPTINGFATFNPPDWNFASVAHPDYPVRVWKYLNTHDLQRGICGLDMVRHIWTAEPDLPMPYLALGATIGLGDNRDKADEYLDDGWSPIDTSGRWGKGRWANEDQAQLSFIAEESAAAPGGDFMLQVNATTFLRPGRTATPVSVEVNGTPIATWHPLSGEQVLQATIPRRLMDGNKLVRVRLLVIPPPRFWLFAPLKRELRLGLFVQSFQVSALPHAATP